MPSVAGGVTRRQALKPAFCALLLALSAGCASGPNAPTRDPVRVDERRGTVDGVGIGDSPTTIQRAIGATPRRGDVRAFPEDLGFTGRSLRFPREISVRDRVRTLRYSDRSFVTTKPSGAFAVFLWSSRARTRGGVRMGDKLASVTKRYQNARCDEEIIDDGPDRVETCTVRMGQRTIAFSGDPITGVTLATAHGR